MSTIIGQLECVTIYPGRRDFVAFHLDKKVFYSSWEKEDITIDGLPVTIDCMVQLVILCKMPITAELHIDPEKYSSIIKVILRSQS